MILGTTTINFDKLAEEVVSVFYAKGTPLTETLSKVASRECLNPDEVRRLVERSNTSAVLQLLKVSSDKKAEIDLADPVDVLRQTHGPQESVKEASDTSIPSAFQIPDTRSQKLELTTFMPKMVKAASMKPKDASEIFRLTKLENELLRTKTAQEITIQDNLDYLVSEFSKRNAPDFSKFASEITQVHGQAAEVLLKGLSTTLEIPIEDLTKTAGVIDDTTPLFKKFAEVLAQLNDLRNTNQEYLKVKTDSANFWKDVASCR